MTRAFDDLVGCSPIRFATTGRRTGLRRERLWLPFGIVGDTIYLVEESPDALWLANIDADGRVDVCADGRPWRPATARRITDPDEDELARRLVGERFDPIDNAFVADGVTVAFDG